MVSGTLHKGENVTSSNRVIADKKKSENNFKMHDCISDKYLKTLNEWCDAFQCLSLLANLQMAQINIRCLYSCKEIKDSPLSQNIKIKTV